MGGAVTKESLFEDEESPHERADFRDYPRLPDEQAENILATTDDVGASAQDGGRCSAPLAIYSNAMRQEQR